MVNLLPPPDASAVPQDVAERLTVIRNKLVRDVAGAAVEIEPALQASAGAVKAQLESVLALPRSQQNRAIREILEAYHVADADIMAAAVADQLNDAAGFAAEYGRSMEALKLATKAGVSASTIIGDSRAAFLLAEGSEPAAAALALEMRPTRAIGTPPPRPVTDGDRIAAANLDRWRGTNNVSAKLHGDAVANSRVAARNVITTIRESESVAESAKRMQRLMRQGGSELAQNDALPKLLSDLEEAGRRMANGGGPEAKRAWEQSIRALNRYQRTLRESGTVRKAYLDLLQTVQSDDFKLSQLDKTIERWTYYKQRYRAEVWIRQETATAYRNLQFEQDKGRSWIIAYTWRMHRQTHNRWVKRGKSMGRIKKTRRKPGKKKRFGGRHCACELLDGKRLSIEAAREYGTSGAHPNCNCSLEPVYSKQKLLDAPETTEETAFLDSFGV